MIFRLYMNKLRLLIIIIITILSGLLAFGIWSRPEAQDIDAEGFSAERVVTDIKHIAHSHHSVAHPKERANVRRYLYQRLESLGANSIELFEYKGLVGPENKHVKYTFDAVNILAEFYPNDKNDTTTNILIIAHYDSRYSQPMPHCDTVWSYGAADDGYGLGITLEALKQALSYREQWHQGVKILFTDAEEVGMMGMKSMWEKNRDKFENIGLAINIEARGPWGPALLFETSAGNERVMELYAKTSKSPFSYSLTTVVYNYMPNFTDFSIIKDEIPGLNFSTIADINHYHTNLDNIDNVNPKTIQHYGSQIAPIIKEYLCNDKYADKRYLCSTNNTIYFTIPLLGIFVFSHTTYLWFNITIFSLFAILLTISLRRRQIGYSYIIRKSIILLLFTMGVIGIGLLISYLCCIVTNVPFKPFGITQGIPFDNIAMSVATIIMAIVTIIIYMKYRQKFINKSSSLRASATISKAAKYATVILFAQLIILFIFSAILLFTIEENIMFFIPLAIATIAILLYHLTCIKLWLALAIGLILLHAFSFLFALAMALTIGAYAIVMMLAFLHILVILPLADMYITSKR